jgi:hypothetical protein
MSILLGRQRKDFKAFEKNMKWFQDNYEKLREQFSGEYVAVNNSQVVMHDKDARTLISRLRQQCEDVGVFVVEFVSKEKVELIL